MRAGLEEGPDCLRLAFYALGLLGYRQVDA